MKLPLSLHYYQQAPSRPLEAAMPLIHAENNNLRVIGLKILAKLVEKDASLAESYQAALVTCLDDADETLTHETLNLLFSVTTPHNISVLVDHTVQTLGNHSSQSFARTLTAMKLVEVVCKHAPTSAWFMRTIFTVLQLDVQWDQHEERLFRIIVQHISQGTEYHMRMMEM
jgi:hypothetical protein